MTAQVSGIHHITAICGNPQRNLDFYAGVLGIRLVKKTVNFDDPGTYHLYYGDETGSPGSLVTFFPWQDMPAGIPGMGEATTIAFAIPLTSFEYWIKRFDRFDIQCQEQVRLRGTEKALLFRDPDGIQLELVGVHGLEDHRNWNDSPVPDECSIRKLHSVALTLEEVTPTVELLTQSLGFREADEEEKRKRYECGPGGASTIVDLIFEPLAKSGRMGKGSIHHVAFRTSDKESQLLMKEKLLAHRLQITDVIDRDYFHSVYFREPGGTLLEVATDSPGFTRDEPLEELGSELKLPEQYKGQEKRILEMLPELKDIETEVYRD
ncbi:MAG: ring-cleaving dioxygenase [Balneolales bacterium]